MKFHSNSIAVIFFLSYYFNWNVFEMSCPMWTIDDFMEIVSLSTPFWVTASSLNYLSHSFFSAALRVNVNPLNCVPITFYPPNKCTFLTNFYLKNISNIIFTVIFHCLLVWKRTSKKYCKRDKRRKVEKVASGLGIARALNNWKALRDALDLLSSFKTSLWHCWHFKVLWSVLEELMECNGTERVGGMIEIFKNLQNERGFQGKLGNYSQIPSCWNIAWIFACFCIRFLERQWIWLILPLLKLTSQGLLQIFMFEGVGRG